MSEIALDYNFLPPSSETRNKRRSLPPRVRRWAEAAKNSLFHRENADAREIVNGAVRAVGGFIAPMATEYYKYQELTGANDRERQPGEKMWQFGKIAAAAGIDLLSIGMSLIPTSGIPKPISELRTMAPYLVGGISAIKDSLRRR